MEVCDICKHLDGLGSDRGDPNRIKFSDITKSADGGCCICGILRDGYELAVGPNKDDEIRITIANDEENGGVYISENTMKTVHFFAWKGEGCPWRSVKSVRLSKRETDAKSCARIIASQMQRCQNEHQLCQNASNRSKLRPASNPTRLIYVGDQTPDDLPLLYETTKESKKLEYIALSHCWGKSQIIRTTKSTLSTHRQGIRWSSLSKTFQDTIAVARALEIDYLWIDSLCIIQDDTNDWAQEASKMQHVYRNSYITISATGAENGDQGLFFTRPNIHQLSGNWNGIPYEIGVRELHPLGIFSDIPWEDNASYPLLSRAWVLQEQFLSMRVVHFTRDEIVWACIEDYACECKKPIPQQSSIRKRMADNHMEASNPLERDAWSQLVRSYCRLKITYDHDRLPAISSLGSFFDSEEDAYLAGLWKQDLPACLLWRASDGRRSRTSIDPPSSPPSWSWASVECDRILPWPWIAGAYSSIAEVLDVGTYPSTSDLRGVVSGGHITIQSHLIRLESTWKLRYSWDSQVIFRLRDPTSDMPDITAICVMDLWNEQKKTTSGDFERPVYFLTLLGDENSPSVVPYSGLLLSPVESPTPAQTLRHASTKSDFLWERIGVGELRNTSGGALPSFPIESVTIV